MVSYIKKLGIYWLYLIILFLLILWPLPVGIFILISLLLWPISIGIWLWFLYVVYHDAQKIGVNENWWLIALFLAQIGGTIYYFVTKDERREFQKRLKELKELSENKIEDWVLEQYNNNYKIKQIKKLLEQTNYDSSKVDDILKRKYGK